MILLEPISVTPPYVPPEGWARQYFQLFRTPHTFRGYVRGGCPYRFPPKQLSFFLRDITAYFEGVDLEKNNIFPLIPPPTPVI